MDIKDIKAIVDLMKKNALTEFELEHEGVKIKLKRGINTVNNTVDEPVSIPMMSVPAAASSDFSHIKSPMIGTFYRAPSPESDAFVEVGDEVTPDTVVCIIEAMKVMNEIKAEAKGDITQILVENAKPVEFAQPLFKIRPT